MSFNLGDKVRVNLKEVLDGIDEHIQGQIGEVVAVPYGLQPSVEYDYCVLIGRVKFGLNEDELQRVGE